MKTHIYEFLDNSSRREGAFLLNIKQHRLAAGLTQAQLAKKMNVDQTAVSRWESGETKPLKKYHKKLAKVLGCSIEELLQQTSKGE